MGAGTKPANAAWIAETLRTIHAGVRASKVTRLPAMRTESVQPMIDRLTKCGFVVVVVNGGHAVARAEAIRTGAGLDLETTWQQDFEACS